MTAKKHETKHGHEHAEKDAHKADEAAPEAAVKDVPPVIPVQRPTAVGGAGTIVSPPTNDDLAGIVAAAVASGQPATIIVTNESDAQQVRGMVRQNKVRIGVKIKPKQGVRCMWRANPDG